MSARRFVLSAALSLLACGDQVEISSDAQIVVIASTVGPDPDPDGYSLTIDGGNARLLGTNGAVTLDVAPGEHSVLLAGMSEHCSVQGTNPRAVTVIGADQGTVSFRVVCGEAKTGGLRIEVATTGDAPDPDGYFLAVAGAPIRRIAITDAVVFLGLEPGRHLVTLKDLAEPCFVQGGNPQLRTVVPGKAVLTRLFVTCGNLP